MTPELPIPNALVLGYGLRDARAEVLAGVAHAEDLAFALGVEAAAAYVDACGRERGGYFGQAAAVLAEMLRVAAARPKKAIADDEAK